ncbi:hypothetical protein ABPG72_017208 [Tetrahymena utriculariae]
MSEQEKFSKRDNDKLIQTLSHFQFFQLNEQKQLYGQNKYFNHRQIRIINFSSNQINFNLYQLFFKLIRQGFEIKPPRQTQTIISNLLKQLELEFFLQSFTLLLKQLSSTNYLNQQFLMFLKYQQQLFVINFTQPIFFSSKRKFKFQSFNILYILNISSAIKIIITKKLRNQTCFKLLLNNLKTPLMLNKFRILKNLFSTNSKINQNFAYQFFCFRYDEELTQQENQSKSNQLNQLEDKGTVQQKPLQFCNLRQNNKNYVNTEAKGQQENSSSDSDSDKPLLDKKNIQCLSYLKQRDKQYENSSSLSQNQSLSTISTQVSSQFQESQQKEDAVNNNNLSGVDSRVIYILPQNQFSASSQNKIQFQNLKQSQNQY